MPEPDPANGSSSLEPMPRFFSSRMALGFTVQFIFVGLYLPFFPLWLEARNLTPFEISAILAMPLVIRVLASGQVMTLADRQNDRAVLLSWLYVGAAVSILLYIPTVGFWPILAVTLLYNLFFNPVLPLLDSITLSGVRRFDADYGKIRIWGSVAFILANLGGGAFLIGFDPEFILFALILTMALGALISFALPRIGRKRPFQNSPDSDAARKKLFRDRRFLPVLMACGLAQASHAFLYGFGSIYWQSIGVSGALIGFFWAIGVIAEILLFQFSKPLIARFAATGLVAMGCIGGILRWAIFPMVDGVALFLVLQILHGLSFGAVHIGLMHFIMDAVPEDNIGAAQGVGYVLGGAVMGAAVFASGPLYSAIGVQGFWVMALLCLLALLLLLLARSNPKGPVPVETS